MNDDPHVKATTAGPAFRVTILGPEQSEAYEQVYARLDSAHQVVHVFSADGQTHYLSIPIGSALIEWKDAAALQPRPRIPPYGPGAFESLGEQMQRMMEGMGRAFGEP